MKIKSKSFISHRQISCSSRVHIFGNKYTVCIWIDSTDKRNARINVFPRRPQVNSFSLSNWVDTFGKMGCQLKIASVGLGM